MTIGVEIKFKENKSAFYRIVIILIMTIAMHIHKEFFFLTNLDYGF
jgi:hypothetical protein